MELSKGMASTKLTTCVLVFELCLLSPFVHSQIQGCSVEEGIDFFECLGEDKTSSSSIDKCCKYLNQAVQAGYNCLCALFVSYIPPSSSAPLLLPLLNCHISLPPLSLCRVLAPMPIVLPPVSSPTKEIKQPSPRPKDVRLPPYPQEKETPFNSTTRTHNSTVVQKEPKPQPQPQSKGNVVPQLRVSRSGNAASGGIDVKELLFHKTLFLFLLALQDIM